MKAVSHSMNPLGAKLDGSATSSSSCEASSLLLALSFELDAGLGGDESLTLEVVEGPPPPNCVAAEEEEVDGCSGDDDDDD